VSRAQLGAPGKSLWENRRRAIRSAIERTGDEATAKLGHEYISLLDTYATEAAAAGPSFVEIQNTMLFATVGQRLD
jgi:hypothetical protein